MLSHPHLSNFAARLPLSHHEWLVLVVGVPVALLGTYLIFGNRKTKSSTDLERERREYLNRNGRIIDGTLTDFAEYPNPAAHTDSEALPVQLLIYQYEISGVHYEASQDVSDLRAYVDVQSCQLGLPASVRYDPNNPLNSMVVSESWSGLRSGMIASAQNRSTR
jgi:hypothetical protein